MNIPLKSYILTNESEVDQKKSTIILKLIILVLRQLNI